MLEALSELVNPIYDGLQNFTRKHHFCIRLGLCSKASRNYPFPSELHLSYHVSSLYYRTKALLSAFGLWKTGIFSHCPKILCKHSLTNGMFSLSTHISINKYREQQWAPNGPLLSKHLHGLPGETVQPALWKRYIVDILCVWSGS